MSSRSYFDDVAEDWDSLRSGYFSDAVREAALDALAVTPGARAADVGGGSGFVTEALLGRGLHVIAIDQSPRMVRILRRKFGGSGFEALRGDAASLPVPDACVDYVFANMYLHHVEAPYEAITEMARIVRPGGGIAITDLDAHTYEFLRREHHDRWLGFSHAHVARWLHDAGFSGVAVTPVGTTCNATSDDNVDASIGIFLAFGRRRGDLPPNLT